ncbi:MAG: hypothetical protein N3D72_02075, partial [Candidatus Methanomethyliaceae archaeon]|nr:hypothetical protein [Candidatus Methanomethyliaceae archaeon]
MDLGIKAGFGKIGQISSIAKEQESKKCSLTPILGDVFEDFALKAPHLHEYVHSGMANVDGIPLQFKVALSRDLRTLKKFNIIYPLQDSIFIHVHKGIREPYGLYRPIEPRLPPDKLNLVNKVEELFASIVDENMLPLIKDRKNFLEELFRSIVRKQGEPIEVSK